jgi:hypothetical protein
MAIPEAEMGLKVLSRCTKYFDEPTFHELLPRLIELTDIPELAPSAFMVCSKFVDKRFDWFTKDLVVRVVRIAVSTSSVSAFRFVIFLSFHEQETDSPVLISFFTELFELLLHIILESGIGEDRSGETTDGTYQSRPSHFWRALRSWTSQKPPNFLSRSSQVQTLCFATWLP